MNGWEVPSLIAFAAVFITCLWLMVAGFIWSDRTPTDDR